MKIRTKLTQRFTAVVASIFIGAVVIIQLALTHYREEEFYVRLENRAITIADLLIRVNEVDSATLRLIENYQQDRLSEESIAIYNHEGKLIFSTSDSIQQPLTHSLLKQIGENGPQRIRKKNTRILGFLYRYFNHEYYVVACGFDRIGQLFIRKMLYTRLFLFICSMSCIAIAGWFFAGRALKPLSKVVEEVNQFSPRRLDRRLQVPRHRDEIGRLVSTINTLLQRIEDSFEVQRVFLSGASHEIKNPLTSITAQLQVLLLNPRREDEYREVIRSVLDDLALLNKTAGDLIQYAGLQSEPGQGDLIQAVRIDEVLWHCFDAFMKSKPSYHIRMDLSHLPPAEEQLLVQGNENLLRVAFMNLLDNACKFSRDQTAQVRIHYEQGQIKVRVNDNGIGMPREEVNMIFEPFYRANHTSRKPGHGIGLPLVKRILDLHGASIEMNSELGRGSIFTVSFPTFMPSQA